MTILTFPSVKYTPDQVIFKPDDIPDRFYIIRKGNVRLVNSIDYTEITVLEAGETFGEQAILTGGLRNSSAVAENNVTCIEIPTEVVKKLLMQSSNLITPIFNALILQLYMRNAMAGRDSTSQL